MKQDNRHFKKDWKNATKVGKKWETRNRNVAEIFMQSHWNLHDFTQKLKIKILGHVTSSIFSNKYEKKALAPLCGPNVHLSRVI